MIGILLDVSGSMQRNVGDGVDEKGGAWVRSIFSVIDNLIKHDLSPNNHVFAIGVGAGIGHTVFDLLDTLQHVQKVPAQTQRLTLRDTIERILDILENGGAGTVKKWAPMHILLNVLPRYEAACSLILRKLKSDRQFVRSFVDDFLPSACRDYKSDGSALGDMGAGLGNFGYYLAASAATRFRTATEQDIEDVIDKAGRELMKRVSAQSIFKVHDASNILHGCVDDKELTKERTQELIKDVEPFIYGRTPLIGALKQSADLFSRSIYRDHKKLLFVLSDGIPTDGESFSRLRNEDVTVVTCFITTLHTIDPHRLYSTLQTQWENDAKFMFTLSSTISTQLLPRTIFVKRGWTVDIKNNETKLFLQVNHPDHLKDACNLARDVVTSQDALSDVLTSVSLDMYINQSNKGINAQDQDEKPICYAIASAVVLHLAMKRILGREGGYPDFYMLRDQMISKHGDERGLVGADTRHVLEEVCPQYRLRCKRVDIKGAMKAITSKRPVVARFRLTPKEWRVFRGFLRSNPDNVLTTDEIDISKRQPGALTSGHAVVLTSYNSKCLRLMNSWGTEWGDCGFFNVQNADVLNFEFFDVFWTSDDLLDSEKDYYARHGSEVASKLISRLTGLQMAEFQCPLCHNTSKVTQFKGRLTQATCPVCQGEFKCGEAGNILALNLYLTSLCKSDHDGTKA